MNKVFIFCFFASFSYKILISRIEGDFYKEEEAAPQTNKKDGNEQKKIIFHWIRLEKEFL